jgi:hypothetical protein
MVSDRLHMAALGFWGTPFYSWCSQGENGDLLGGSLNFF